GKVDHNDIAAYYYASNLYATASLTEMNSISMLEAMASGLMVLQRFDVYNKDQITQGENGYMFNDCQEFGELLSMFGGLSPEQREESRKKASAVSRKYGPKEFIEKVINVYELAIHKYQIDHKK
ncbi:MAG: glycosyltransferase, partial [Oscillospiraceae bacterium]